MCTEIELINATLLILTKDKKVEERYAAEIEGLKDRIYQSKQNKYRLGVIGVTSSGKSTMINSFFGERLLPERTKPSSSQLVSCYKGPERKAKVFFADGTVSDFGGDEVSSEQICKYADEFYNEDNKYKVNHIEIESPDFPFPEDLLLVDSPGLGAYGFENHEALTLNSLLPTIDFCLFITTCKSNSDLKMKSILNLIADYNKPVLIVQNMVDSIYLTSNTLESAYETAQRNILKLERVIEESDIRDKSSVKIVQISAIWALAAKLGLNNCNEEVKKDLEDKYKKSNYDLLVSSIINILETLKPRIENQRKLSLRREIEKIAKEAEEDGKGEDLNSLVFEFENLHNEIQNKVDSIRKSLQKILHELKTEEDEVGKKEKSFWGIESYSYVPSQEKLNKITKKINESVEKISSEINSFNKFAQNVCEQLNIDSRNIFTFEKATKIPQIRMITKTETEWVDKDGFFNGVARFFDWGDRGWGQEAVTVKVDDIEGTIAKTIKSIQLEERALKKDIENWLKSSSHTCELIDAQIEKKRQAFEQRKTKALDAGVYREIAKEIKDISNTIEISKEKSSELIHEDAQFVIENRQNVEVEKYTFLIYQLADELRKNIGVQSIKNVTDSSKHVVVGWDKTCEELFTQQYLGKSIDEVINIHNPEKGGYENKLNDNQNIFILVNTTQIGAALDQIDKSEICKNLKESNKLFFVIQDFQEQITSDTVRESIGNMLDIGKELNLKHDFEILINAENPVFNIVLQELQSGECKTHSDEIKLINNLQKKLRFLRNTEIDNICEEIIKGYRKEKINE